MVWNQRESDFTFVPGPVFTDLLLVDEFNRMPPRTQAALLEAMAERHVTIDGRTYALPERFTVIATQNPYEELGTYALPSSVLDRFALRVGAEPLTFADEVRVAGGVANGTLTSSRVSVVDHVDAVRQQVAAVHVAPAVAEFAVAIVTALRQDPRITRRPSVRASAVLLRSSQALAAIRGRSYVLPDDVLELVPTVMAHRCAATIPQPSGEALVREIASRVTVPVPQS
jgi:MoxR-like ATPase